MSQRIPIFSAEFKQWLRQRALLWALLLSVLLHLLMLISVHVPTGVSGDGEKTHLPPLTVNLANKQPAPAKPTQAEPPPASVPPPALPKPSKPKPQKAKPEKPQPAKSKPATTQQEIIAVKSKQQPAEIPLPAPTNPVVEKQVPVDKTPPVKEPSPPPLPKPTPDEAPPEDMMALVKRNQAKRRTEQGESPTGDGQSAMSESQKRDEVIKRNLKMGVNGLFSINYLGTTNAEFVFRGWTNDYSTAKRQVIQVSVESGGDIKRAVVKRMIKLIRVHYDGDFKWESHRLGKVLTLSARPQDNAGLEDFLMQEMFEGESKSFDRP